MKKLFLFFVLLFSPFVFSDLTGLDYTYADASKFDAISTADTFTLILKEDMIVRASSEIIKKTPGQQKVILILRKGSRILNKSGADLVFDSGITVMMEGTKEKPSEIFSENDLTINSKLDFDGYSLIKALDKTEINSCEIKGQALIPYLDAEGELAEKIFVSGKIIKVNVWNPLVFFDGVFFTAEQELIHSKNYSCNRIQPYLMNIPFNGRIRNPTYGTVKNIILTDVFLQTEVQETLVEDEIPFSNGIFSALIKASLYPNSFYRIDFDVCNVSNDCENFFFNFFTWRVLW